MHRPLICSLAGRFRLVGSMTLRLPVSITRRIALLSVGASIVTLLLKFGAYYLTNSVGLLSDAAESGVNLTAALIAFAAISIADRPPDDDHSYGHDKAEYFSSGAEGSLILIAAVSILYAAGKRILNPAPVENVGIGVLVAAIASTINFGVSRIMLRVSKQHDSIALEADAHHLMTDVWTSVGVIGGVILVGLTGWEILDPLLGIAVGINIIWMGIKLIRRSTQGLMDQALPPAEINIVREALVKTAGADTPYHALRTRKSGSRRFVEMHLLVPGSTTVRESHDMVLEIEASIQEQLANTFITVHVEPLEDTASWDGHLVGGLSSDGQPDLSSGSSGS